MFADYHLHTEYSDDSVLPMADAVRQAIALGIDEICFTDHVDYGVKYDKEELPALSPGREWLENVDYPAYFRQIAQLQRAYGDRITIKKGLELGVQTHTVSRYQKLFDSWEMDFVILSCHQVGDQEFWTGDFQQGRTQDEYNQRYYQEILDCMRLYKSYSVLGHLDMIQRYNETRHPFEKSRDILATILEQAIRDGKGIELNTSSFQYGIPDLMPERKILALYRDLGGEIITVGSDAHTADRIGDRIPEIYQELRGMGFAQICTFEKMQPVFHAL